MRLRRSDMADLLYFQEVAKTRNFRRAGLELGVTASAISHALRAFEERVGVRLFNRTSRSVTLTAAGEALDAAIRAPMENIGHALEALNTFRNAPMGRVRLSMSSDAAEFLVAPVMAEFIELYPDVEIEMSVSNRMIDVIGSGFDAGIRYGGTVPEDMIAQRLSADIRWIVVGGPAYLDAHGAPVHPDDLLSHRCVKIRIGDDSIYRWEFERGDETCEIDVPGTMIVDDFAAALTAVKKGAGLIYVNEHMAREGLSEGSLRIVLQDWAPLGPGYCIYYSSRRQAPAALRHFIDFVREKRPLGL